MHTLYTFGYQRSSLSDLGNFQEDTGAIVADVRLKPWSQNHQWTLAALRAFLGDRYIHIRELGNLNYKGGPIQINDPVAGFHRLEELLHAQPVIILCVCGDYHACHRWTVAMMMEQHSDNLDRVEHLPYHYEDWRQPTLLGN